MRVGVLIAMAWLASSGVALAQDAAAGEALFKRNCTVCHDVGEGAKIKLGPPLNGIDGRAAGSYPGYNNYSEANKTSGITWNEDAFKTYIRSPMTAMPGTRMAFIGLKSDQEITDLWAYLKQFDQDGKKK